MSTPAPRARNSRKIAFPSKLSFGVGQLAEGLKNWSFAALVMFYYNQVLEVPGTICGIVLGIALVFDAVTDPLAGSLSDNLHSRFGRRHPFMVASALPLALAFYGLFSPPVGLSPGALGAWLLAFSVLTRAAMTLYHVPHMALGAELTEDFEERTSIVAYRQAFGTLGGLLAAILAFGFAFTDARGGRTNAAAYAPFALQIAVLMSVTILISAWGTRREIPFLPKPGPKGPGTVLSRLVAETRIAFQSDSFRWLFAGVLIVFLMVGVNTVLDIYMFQYFWELESQQFLWLSIAAPVGLVLGTLAVRPFHHHFGKRAGLQFGTGGWALLQFLPVTLRLLDWFPENESAALVPTLLVIKFFQGAIVQQALVSFGSMMADVADEHELETGRRSEGIFFGAVAFSGKGASGLGTFVAGFGLDLIGWPRGADIQTAADVGAETLVELGLLYGPGIAVFSTISMWCYTHYHLDREAHALVLEKLNARHEGDG